MILKLKRGIADFIEQGIEGLQCFSDRAANELGYYPCVYITEINEKRAPLGCGRVDYTERSPLGSVTKNGKIIEYKTALRFLIAAPHDSYESAAEKTHRLGAQIDRLFLDAVCLQDIIEFVDPISSENLQVVGIRFLSAIDVPPETESEPMLFYRALTYRIVHRLHLEEGVEFTMDNLQITQGGVNV